MGEQRTEIVKRPEITPCPNHCIHYNQDSVICNEDYEICVYVVCPKCGKPVVHTPYCINCRTPLRDAKKPYEETQGE